MKFVPTGQQHWTTLSVTRIPQVKPHYISARIEVDESRIAELIPDSYTHALVTASGIPTNPLLGILSRRDLARNADRWPRASHKRKVKELMTAFHESEQIFLRLHQSSTLITAIEKFITKVQDIKDRSWHNISALPIMNEAGCAVGLITVWDVLELAVHGIIPIPPLTVNTCLFPYAQEHKPQVATADNTLSDILAFAAYKHVRAIPVVTDANKFQLLGLTSDRVVFTYWNNNRSDSTLTLQIANNKVMIPLEKLDILLPSDPLDQAIKLLVSKPFPDVIAVVQNRETDRLLGIISAIDILQVLNKSSALDIPSFNSMI